MISDRGPIWATKGLKGNGLYITLGNNMWVRTKNKFNGWWKCVVKFAHASVETCLMFSSLKNYVQNIGVVCPTDYCNRGRLSTAFPDPDPLPYRNLIMFHHSFTTTQFNSIQLSAIFIILCTCYLAPMNILTSRAPACWSVHSSTCPGWCRSVVTSLSGSCSTLLGHA